MSHKGNRHQRRPSQGVFVFPDNLSDPLPKNDAGEQPSKGLSGVDPPVSVVDRNGVPLPTPPAKSSSGEISSADNNASSKSKAATSSSHVAASSTE
ncbi:OLC1v1034790C1 [Oldenlandia corymbosa var. corymbosa]|uniref:OLC1v1034790C1 n=1 Tax=Oldenlandia corymbosa var. corymbosa TaxID=529605 RepID=A0AAV1CU29_OLDCO|nr:OLC1v1034790C1 [Oldenlandia corymbosa var. corymbosa]